MAQDFKLRRNMRDGIFYRGYRYEAIPTLRERRFIAIVEECDGYLMVSDLQQYGDPDCFGTWYTKSHRERLRGGLIRVNRIDVGRPTQERIDKLKDELKYRAARAAN